jgi:hypothetical protein
VTLAGAHSGSGTSCSLLLATLPVIMTVIPTKDKDFGASDRDLPNNPCFPGRGLPTQARDSGSRGSLSGALQVQERSKLEEQDSDKPGRGEPAVFDKFKLNAASR